MVHKKSCLEGKSSNTNNQTAETQKDKTMEVLSGSVQGAQMFPDRPLKEKMGLGSLKEQVIAVNNVLKLLNCTGAVPLRVCGCLADAMPRTVPW